MTRNDVVNNLLSASRELFAHTLTEQRQEDAAALAALIVSGTHAVRVIVELGQSGLVTLSEIRADGTAEGHELFRAEISQDAGGQIKH